MRLILLLLPALLFAVSSEDLKLEINKLENQSDRFRLVVTAPAIDEKITLEVKSGSETKLIVLQKSQGAGEYSAVDYLPEPSINRRFFLRGINGKTEAVMIKYIVIKK